MIAHLQASHVLFRGRGKIKKKGLESHSLTSYGVQHTLREKILYLAHITMMAVITYASPVVRLLDWVWGITCRAGRAVVRDAHLDMTSRFRAAETGDGRK